MPLIVILIGLAFFVVLCLIGLAWTLFLLTPYYLVIGVVIYIVVRSKRRQAELAASVEIEAEWQRRLNAQELKAWHDAVDYRQKQLSKRETDLQRFDRRNDRLL